MDRSILFLLGHTLALILLISSEGIGQQDLFDQESEQDTLSNIIMNADTVFHISDGTAEIDTLVGNVILNQDSLVMYCNRAVVIDQINARAYEDVVIIHHDTIQIFADSMLYNGELKIANLYGEVILQDGVRRLYTSSLKYNVGLKTAEYNTGGTIINQMDTVVSKEGFYYQKEKRVNLKGNVTYRDTVRELKTDSILYLFDIDQLNLLAPTTIAQDSIDIYCEGGLYRLKSDRGVLTDNVQVRSDSLYITSGLLDIDGEAHTYTFLLHPELQDAKRYSKGDTIIYNDQSGTIELRSNALYLSEKESLRAPVITYNKHSGIYSTEGRAKIETSKNVIEANEVISEDNELTRLVGNVSITEHESNMSIQSDEAIQSGEFAKMYSHEKQPLLTYSMTSDSLLLIADTLISKELVVFAEAPFVRQMDTLLMDTIHLDSALVEERYDSTEVIQNDTVRVDQMFYAIDKVRFRNGRTYGASNNFEFNQTDSIMTLTSRPIIWSDSTQLTGDTIKIFLKNNEVYRISLINNAFIIAPDSTGMLNQIKGQVIDNYISNNSINEAIVKGNAELFYMIKDGDTYQGINLTKSNEMTFIFEDEEISKILMQGQPESNMHEYSPELDISPYYLDGFEWRIKERPQNESFLLRNRHSK